MSSIIHATSNIDEREIAATPETAPTPCPSPRIVFLGLELRLVGLIDLYQLHGNPDFALTDRRSELGGSHYHGHQTFPFDQLNLDRLETVIVTEEPFKEHTDALSFLESKGIPREKIATICQPGKAHRALSKILDHPPEYNRQIGYLAIRRNFFHRGHYAYGMVLAAEMALRMSLTKISAIEFGVWYGAGLKNLCEIADFLQQTLGIQFLIYGFDTGEGLPEVADWRDHPELWPSGSLVMPNFEELRSQLPENCQLIIGDVKDTLPVFLEKYGSAEAPIGFVSLDVDQYHSSVSALKVFDADPTYLAPAVPIWVDDSYLNVLQTTYAGEGLAIREFNDQHQLRKIEQKIVRTDDFPRLWHHCIYFAHIFDHPIRQGRATARFDQFYHTDY
jgi:hypothetical protein